MSMLSVFWFPNTAPAAAATTTNNKLRHADTVAVDNILLYIIIIKIKKKNL